MYYSLFKVPMIVTRTRFKMNSNQIFKSSFFLWIKLQQLHSSNTKNVVQVKFGGLFHNNSSTKLIFEKLSPLYMKLEEKRQIY